MPAPPPQYEDRHPDLGSRMGRAYDRYQARYGRWLAYLRTDRRFPCDCYDPTTRSGTCMTCYGTGFSTRPERMRALLSAPENLSALVTTVNIGDWGRLDEYPGLLYIPRGYSPQQQDLVAEAEWDVPTDSVALYGRPTRVARVWKISALIPVLFNASSQVDYYLAGLQQHSLEMGAFQERLVHDSILPPQRGSLPGGQTKSEPFTPAGGNTGTRSPQKESPGSAGAGRVLGRASRVIRPGL